MSKKTSLIILILVSLGIHFAFFGRPNETVFDEVHFGKFVSSYYTGEYHFDIHPPGGKLMIAGFAKLFNFTPEYSFAQIGQKFPDHKYLALRFLPALAGFLLAIVIYFLALELGFSVIAAFGAGMLITLDNALLTQSRYILLDPFLLLFGFSTLLFYFRWHRVGGQLNLLSMAIFAGLATSIKWTGIGFLGLAGIIELIQVLKNISIRRVVYLFLYFALVPLLIYFSIFLIHFSLLTKSGEGDAFMTPAFQSSLKGSTYENDPALKPLNIVQKFTELNGEMYRANSTLTATHSYGSRWYTWPFMTRPIYYWNGSTPSINSGQAGSPQVSGIEGKIYLIGNPFIWWSSTVALLYLLFTSLGKDFFRKKTVLIILGGYFLNLLPFIGVSRVMFLYHYLPSLVFAILALAYLLDQHRDRKKIILSVLAISALFFLWFSPLSYGLPLEASEFMRRIWLPSWQ